MLNALLRAIVIVWTAHTSSQSPPGRPVHSDTNSTYQGSTRAELQLLCEDHPLAFPPLSIARYSYTQLSELGRRGENENAQSSKQQRGDSSLGSRDYESSIQLLSECAPRIASISYCTPRVASISYCTPRIASISYCLYWVAWVACLATLQSSSCGGTWYRDGPGSKCVCRRMSSVTWAPLAKRLDGRSDIRTFTCKHMAIGKKM